MLMTRIFPWRRGILALLLQTFMVSPLMAQEANYLAEMPASQRVIADFAGGRDELDTLARQTGALQRLHRMVGELGGRRYATQGATPAERTRQQDYAEAAGLLRQRALDRFGAGPHAINSPRARWVGSVDRYERSGDVYTTLLAYFSPAVQAQHRAQMAAMGQAQAEGRALINQGLRELGGETGSEWEQQSPESRQGAIAWISLLSLLLGLGILRELLPVKVTGGTIPSLRVGLRRYRLNTVTGTLGNWRAELKSTTTFWERHEAGGGVRRWTTNESVMTEHFDLDGPQGTGNVQIAHLVPPFPRTAEQHADLVSQSLLGSLQGQPLSMLLVTRRWRRRGTTVMFRRPGGEYVATALTDPVVDRLVSVRAWTFWPAAMLGFVIAASTGVLSGVLGGTSPNLRGMFGFFIAGLLWFGLFAMASHIRGKRFTARQLPRLRELLD